MDMKLELIPIPVADVDRAKAFYVDKLGFADDVDVRPAEGVRVVQLTPPSSMCSISIGTGLPVYEDSIPGSVKGIHLVVADIERGARRTGEPRRGRVPDRRSRRGCQVRRILRSRRQLLHVPGDVMADRGRLLIGRLHQRPSPPSTRRRLY